MMKPIKAVANPNITKETMIAAHNSMVFLFVSTALILVTTAVMASVFLSINIGRENALVVKTMVEKTAPTAVPMPRKRARSMNW